MFEIVLIHQSDENAFSVQRAEKAARENEGLEIRLHSYDAWCMDAAALEECKKKIEHSDFILLLLHGGLSWFEDFAVLKEALYQNGRFFFHSEIEEENILIQKESCLLPEEVQRLSSCCQMGGTENFCRLFRYLIRIFQKEKAEQFSADAEELRPAVREGIWNVPKEAEEEYREQAWASGRPVIGILVHYKNCLKEDTAHIAALQETVWRKGGFPLPVVSTMQPMDWSEGIRGSIRHYFQKDGKTRIDALIVTTGFSMSMLAQPGEGRHSGGKSIFEELQIPVFQAITSGMSLEKWQKSAQGMDTMSIGSSIFEPELDGQIITTVIACTEQILKDGQTQRQIIPIPDRIERVAGLAVNWGRLRKKPGKEKKIAILLHNMPPRRDMIGCAYGLDVPNSVWHMLQVLQEEGLVLERQWESGEALIQELLEGLTNEYGYLKEEEIEQKAAGVLEGNAYRAWFAALPEQLRQGIELRWGEAPGSVLVQKDRILIPGIQNGNLFIGIQPARETQEYAEEAAHSLERPCPHQYLGYYKWIREEFGADLIYHMGAHGTLEWLPGKSVCLSEACAPDAALGELPNAYPYIVNLPGEGTQAKRRSSAVLISHMVPAMQEAGLYGELAELSELLEQYEQAEKYDKKQKEILKRQILTLAQGIEEPAWEQEPEDTQMAVYVQRLHSRIEEIRHSQIRDGLHILGEGPQGERLEHMLDFLKLGGGSKAEWRQLLGGVSQELEAVRRVFRGAFIAPSESGCPSRGNRQIFPTGRNFYGIHPAQIPSRAAWSAGMELAEELLTRIQKDRGKLPEALTLVVYSGETMKTSGDTIAEILFLLGVRPIWREGTDQIADLELIPLEELRRPRIDVTVRVSGLFRDNFPNLIELLDDAVNLAVSAPEALQQNYVRAHVLRDVRKMVEQGIERERAEAMAAARIFSCPPGQYGAGVTGLIESGAWENNADLAESYVRWSSFAYGRKLKGEAVSDTFMARLADSEAVVKNMSSVEEDLMESDDFYNYVGGAVSAASLAKGEKAAAYTVSTSDGKGYQVRKLEEEAERLYYARLQNPQWAESLRRHGYRGAQEISAMFDTVFGWSAVTEVITDQEYEGLLQRYLVDPRQKEWIASANPWALQHICERLLEAEARGLWHAKEDSLQLTRQIYLDMEGSLEELGG